MRLLRVLQSGSATALLALAAAVPAQAQVTRVESGRQAIGFNLGYFAVKGLDSRVDEDVLLANLSQGEFSLAFDVKDFSGFTFGGEYLIGLNDYLEAGVGLGYYQRTVPSIYDQKVRDDGREIAQDLKLRIVPLTGTIRFLPVGRNGIAPYVGAGIGAFNWRYSETGEFIDSDGFTFTDRFVDSGWTAGPVILGGVRFPVGDVATVGGELRYQKAEGKGLLDERFLGDKIDLGGWTTSFTMHFKF
jgi:Outer membrane protein beta-barrel domain